MSQGRAVFRNTAVLAAARIIERVSGLVLTLVIARQLGAAGLGIYATAMAYFALIATAGEAGTTNLLVREIANDRTRAGTYIVHTSAMAAALCLALMAGAWFALPLLGYSDELTASLRVVVLAVLPGTLNTIQEAAFVAHQRVELQTLTTLASSLLLIAISLALLANDHGIVSLIAAFVAVQYAVTVTYFVILNKLVVRLRWGFRKSVAVQILRDIRAFTGLSLISGFFSRPEVIILSIVATEVQVGLYTAALKLVDLFQFIPQVFMTNVYPVLSRSFHIGDRRAQEIQDRSLRYLLALILPIAAGLFFAADPIVAAFYGERFEPAVVLLRVLALALPLYCLHSVLWRVLAARREQGRVLRVQIFTTFTRLGAGAALISALGAVGAVIAMPASMGLHVALLARAVRSDGTRIPLLRLSARFAAAAAVMGVVVLALAGRLPLPLLAAAGALLYAALLSPLRAFSSDELEFLRGLRAQAFRRMRPLG